MSTISLQQWALKSRVMNTVKDWKQKLHFCVLDRNIKILYSLKRKYVSMGIWFFIYMYTIILAGEMFLSKIWLLVFECLHLNFFKNGSHDHRVAIFPSSWFERNSLTRTDWTFGASRSKKSCEQRRGFPGSCLCRLLGLTKIERFPANPWCRTYWREEEFQSGLGCHLQPSFRCSRTWSSGGRTYPRSLRCWGCRTSSLCRRPLSA